MDWLEAFILGLLQGLTEFLPISSSGHLEIGKVLLGIDAEQSLIFTVVVHGATVLSTIIVFWSEVKVLFRGLFSFKYNDETSYVLKIIVSMIPVGIVGLFFKEKVESFFTGNLNFVGSMLIITSLLLAVTYLFKAKNRAISWLDAFIIGVAQAMAVLPGISRSGATIATSLILGNSRDKAAQFSFLMVILPILGANTLELLSYESTIESNIHISSLIIGFIAALIAGLFACKWMISIVKRGKLIYFAAYCMLIGVLSLVLF